MTDDATTPEQPLGCAECGMSRSNWAHSPRSTRNGHAFVARPAVASEGWEAAAQASADWATHAKEQTPAVASEGVRAALKQIEDYRPSYNAIEDRAEMRRIARAALASDAGSVTEPDYQEGYVLDALEERAIPAGKQKPPGLSRRSQAATGVDPVRPAHSSASVKPQSVVLDAGSVGALNVERLRVIAGINENRVTVEQADALGWLDGWLDDAERQGAGFYDDPNAPGNER